MSDKDESDPTCSGCRCCKGSGFFTIDEVRAQARTEALEEAALVAVSHRWGMRHEPGEVIARDIRALGAKP